MADREDIRSRQRILADFGEFALRSEELEEVLAEACRLVAAALGTGRAKILEIAPDRRSLLVRAGVGWPEVVGRVRLPMKEHSSETYSITAGRPVITRDLRTETRFTVPAFMRDAGVVALANVPVFLPGGRTYGLLQVDSTEPRDFGPEDSEFLRTYAAILGPVIDRLHTLYRLRASEERFRLVVENARDYAIFIADAEDRIIDWFPGAEAVFGWSAAEILGQPGGTVFTPEDRAAGADIGEIETARREGSALNRRWHLRRDGSRVFIEGRVIALRGAEGEARGFLKIGQDVTERRAAEERLRESEERLRSLVNATTYAIFRMTPDWSEMQRMDARGLVSETPQPDRRWIDAYVAPEDQPALRQAIARAIAARAPLELEHRVRRPDGSLAWTLSRAVPLLTPAGEVREWIGTASDVSARRNAEEALRRAEERQRALLEGLPQLVWRSGPGGDWRWAGRQWVAHTGLSEAASLGQGWLAAVHPADREAVAAVWERATREGGPFEAEHRIRRAADGAWRWFQSHALPVRAPGTGLEWFGTCTDVDDQRRAREVLTQSRERLEEEVAARTAELMAVEESLRQAQKMEAVGQLTGGIAHDFNNMLQGVVGGLAMARRQIGAHHPERADRYLDAAYGAAERAAGLTRRLLAFARRQRLDPRPVDADGLVAGLAELIRRTMGPAIAVELRLRDGAGSVLCDANELESALINLCINARDAMPEGGRLTIGTAHLRLAAEEIPDEAGPPGPYLAITVADTGTGMPPAVLDRVFEPFFTTKPQGQGTGLGLSQVYGFVRQSGGLVRIESAPGAGTEVRLLLPLHAAPAEAPGEHALPVPVPDREEGGATLLLVDDEEAVRQPAADRLRELGLVVLEARDGPEALRVLDEARPAMLITDVGLPGGMNGRQVAEAARARLPGLPVLFISGYSGTVLEAGVEVIAKPFDLDTLARRVQAILRQARSG